MIDDFVRPPAAGQRPPVPHQKPIQSIRQLKQPALASLPAAAKQESGFQTPEQVAAKEERPTPAVEPPTGPRSKQVKRQWPFGKKQTIIMAAVAFVVLASASVAAYAFTRPGPTPVATHQHEKTPAVPPKPTTVASTLTGLPVDPSANKRPVTGVMIENSLDARPQSGLAQAGVVFEAVAEGGVTRFLALYQDQVPANIGPIRSARPYFIQWAMGFDAGYAHVGGSPDGLADIKAWGVRDLDQFYNGGSYHRISSRAAPHNVYTGIDTLNQLETKKGYTTSTFAGFVRGKEAPSQQPNATSIDFQLSGYDYDPHFTYSAAANSYDRSEMGQPQLDANTGKQLSPKVVIAIVVPMAQGALDSSGAYYSDYNPIGSGQAYVFQNGTVTIGQWQKASNTTNISFTDSSGQPLPLNPGQTWITAVTSTNRVSYK